MATTTLVSTLAWAAVCGAALGIVVVPQQHRLIALSPAAAPVLLGLNSSAVYVGMALRGLVGLAHEWLAIAPAALGLLAALSRPWRCSTTWQPHAVVRPQRPSRPPPPRRRPRRNVPAGGPPRARGVVAVPAAEENGRRRLAYRLSVAVLRSGTVPAAPPGRGRVSLDLQVQDEDGGGR